MERSGRPSVLSDEHIQFIDEQIDSQRQITTTDLALRFYNKFNLIICHSTIRAGAERSNWQKVTTRYCQIVSPENMIKRVMYAHYALLVNDTFDDCIFIDESIIELEVHSLTKYTLN